MNRLKITFKFLTIQIICCLILKVIFCLLAEKEPRTNVLLTIKRMCLYVCIICLKKSSYDIIVCVKKMDRFALHKYKSIEHHTYWRVCLIASYNVYPSELKREILKNLQLTKDRIEPDHYSGTRTRTSHWLEWLDLFSPLSCFMCWLFV